MKLRCSVFVCALYIVVAMARATAEGALDSLQFGVPDSETAHHVEASESETGTGGLGQSDRIFLPLKPAAWKGGRVSFIMKVKPDIQNYVTVRFWGDDITENRLVMYIEGKQIGWFHLGEIDCLDAGNDDSTSAYNGRFFYHTSPLPLSITSGKTEVNLEIRSMGRIWGYGQTWDQYQKDMDTPSRGIYSVYTHTDTCFIPPSDEVQGKAPIGGVRTSPGPEVLDEVKTRVNQEIDSILNRNNPPDEMQMQFLANAYWVKWCNAYKNPKVVQQVIAGMDALYATWQANPKILLNPPGAYNGGWLRFGPAGAAVQILAPPLQSSLDEVGANRTGMRRTQWAEMLKASRDDALANRRLYTNQTMIVDLNAYRANRALEAIDPGSALPEARMLDYLKQSIGLKPWLGSDTPTGSEKPMGDNYWELTQQGLTKELGYVGYYGEVSDWVGHIYEATRSITSNGFGLGDEAIRQQLVKVVKARAIFRYPMLDGDGHPAMRIEAVVGWRDEGHYPGNIAYAERPSWDASALFVAPATGDPEVIGYAQQMLKDNQFFDSVSRSLKDGGLRVTAGLLNVPDEYEYMTHQKPTGYLLPMTIGQKDFVWADEEDGVIAIKHQDEVFYASLYWRARNSINFLARVHYTVPGYDRIAEVHEDEQFIACNSFYTRPDWINMAFGNGGIRYPDDMHSAFAGEKLPISQVPAGVNFNPGDENPYAGRATFYQLRYGHYLIGMNSGKTSVQVHIPLDAKSAENLSTHETLAGGSVLTVAPGTTAALILN